MGFQMALMMAGCWVSMMALMMAESLVVTRDERMVAMLAK